MAENYSEFVIIIKRMGVQHIVGSFEEPFSLKPETHKDTAKIKLLTLVSLNVAWVRAKKLHLNTPQKPHLMAN